MVRELRSRKEQSASHYTRCGSRVYRQVLLAAVRPPVPRNQSHTPLWCEFILIPSSWLQAYDAAGLQGGITMTGHATRLAFLLACAGLLGGCPPADGPTYTAPPSDKAATTDRKGPRTTSSP